MEGLISNKGANSDLTKNCPIKHYRNAPEFFNSTSVKLSLARIPTINNQVMSDEKDAWGICSECCFRRRHKFRISRKAPACLALKRFSDVCDNFPRRREKSLVSLNKVMNASLWHEFGVFRNFLGPNLKCYHVQRSRKSLRQMRR